MGMAPFTHLYGAKLKGDEMKLYIYDTNTMVTVATITRDSNAECEAVAAENFDLGADYGCTYSPAFGAADGLIDTDCPEL